MTISGGDIGVVEEFLRTRVTLRPPLAGGRTFARHCLLNKPRLTSANFGWGGGSISTRSATRSVSGKCQLWPHPKTRVRDLSALPQGEGDADCRAFSTCRRFPRLQPRNPSRHVLAID